MNSPRDSLWTIEIKDGNKVFLLPFFLTIIQVSLLGLAVGLPCNLPIYEKIYKQSSERCLIQDIQGGEC